MLTNGTKTQSHRAWQNELGMSFPRHNPPPGLTVVATTPPEPTLDELKQRKRNEINSEINQRLHPGRIETPVAPVDLRSARDEANLTKIRTESQALALSGDTTTTIQFRDADNVIHDLTAQQALDMTGAALAHGQQVYATSWQLKDVDLANATTPAEVEAVAWPEA